MASSYLVRAGRRNRHLPERQSERVGLRLEQFDADGVHRDTPGALVDRRQERANRDVGRT